MYNKRKNLIVFLIAFSTSIHWLLRYILKKHSFQFEIILCYVTWYCLPRYIFRKLTEFHWVFGKNFKAFYMTLLFISLLTLTLGVLFGNNQSFFYMLKFSLMRKLFIYNLLFYTIFDAWIRIQQILKHCWHYSTFIEEILLI